MTTNSDDIIIVFYRIIASNCGAMHRMCNRVEDHSQRQSRGSVGELWVVMSDINVFTNDELPVHSHPLLRIKQWIGNSIFTSFEALVYSECGDESGINEEYICTQLRPLLPMIIKFDYKVRNAWRWLWVSEWGIRRVTARPAMSALSDDHTNTSEAMRSHEKPNDLRSTTDLYLALLFSLNGMPFEGSDGSAISAKTVQ